MIRSIEADKNNMSMEQYGLKFNPEAIKKTVSDVRKSSEFKTLMSGLKPADLVKIAASPDKRSLEENVNALHKKFVDIIHAKPVVVSDDHNKSKDKEARMLR